MRERGSRFEKETRTILCDQTRRGLIRLVNSSIETRVSLPSPLNREIEFSIEKEGERKRLSISGDCSTQ